MSVRDIIGHADPKTRDPTEIGRIVAQAT